MFILAISLLQQAQGFKNLASKMRLGLYSTPWVYFEKTCGRLKIMTNEEQMIEDHFLNEFLENRVQKAKENIQQKGRLETEDAIPLMLKSQFNHIAHLEQEMVTKTEFAGLKQQFEGLNSRFTFSIWLITFGFTFLGALQTYLALR